ncbi:dTDP-4-dehydrorhamnose reductase [uncultured Rhodoblastus sp.]|uniref:dTDP-4-dehydrorhamnose reductase n=1 Tax=uncultured Rhodoblastus sp. TaxID=543037 RepID=UPI0025E1DA70|nr:dTDP-4-dehydrorhamnose reductase [uncultured Rhodoblastus sp.]
MRLVVTGSQGQVVRALIERAGPELEIVALGRPELDLEHPGDLAALFSRHAPDAIVNAAAYTAVDKAESERETAFAVNGAGAGAVAAAARRLNVPVVQISTDYVFDGSGDRPLRETDPTGPIGVYGASKLAGEQAVAAAAPDHVILRTAWVYAPFGANFVRTMLRLAAARDELKVVGDQFGTPTSALDIAAAIESVARHLVARRDAARLRGIFHMTAKGGPISWADFAAEIFRQSALRGGPGARVTAIPTSEYPTPARRPAWSCLDGGKLAAIHGVTLPDWRDALAQTIERLAAQGEWQ